MHLARNYRPARNAWPVPPAAGSMLAHSEKSWEIGAVRSSLWEMYLYTSGIGSTHMTTSDDEKASCAPHEEPHSTLVHSHWLVPPWLP